MDHFNITVSQAGDNGVLTTMIKAAVIQDVTQGIVPQHQTVPFNPMKSETLVWVIQGVDYLETVVRRERRGSSQCLRIRVARGVYYQPSTSRSRPIKWEETLHQDTGLLGPTTKHIYLAPGYGACRHHPPMRRPVACLSGSRKKFRIRYDRIVSFDPYDDGVCVGKAVGRENGQKKDRCHECQNSPE